MPVYRRRALTRRHLQVWCANTAGLSLLPGSSRALQHPLGEDEGCNRKPERTKRWRHGVSALMARLASILFASQRGLVFLRGGLTCDLPRRTPPDTKAADRDRGQCPAGLTVTQPDRGPGSWLHFSTISGQACRLTPTTGRDNRSVQGHYRKLLLRRVATLSGSSAKARSQRNPGGPW